MTKDPRVLIHNDDPVLLELTLRAAFPNAQVRGCSSYQDLPDALAAFRPDVVYSVRFAGTPGFPRDALFGAHAPAWVANGGVGTDHFGQWEPENITVTNAAGVAADMMAEYVLGGFLHFTLDIDGLVQDKADRLWQPRRVRSLKGQTLLIVGLGHTGRALAKRAKAFGMQVLGTRAHPQDTENVDEVHSAADVYDLLPRADFIAVATPLIAATRGLLGPKAFDAMKPGAILADVSRGGVIEQAALLAALHTGRLAGAVLDVFETEPLPPDNPLWTQRNVILSPHCSSVFDGWEMASFEMFLDNLQRWIDGDPLVNVVDPIRGY